MDDCRFDSCSYLAAHCITFRQVGNNGIETLKIFKEMTRGL